MATEAVAPLTLLPSPAVTNALLAWPAEDKLALARALRESVAGEGIDPDDERERNRALIHSRLAELTSGKAKLLDADEVFATLRSEFPEEGP